jgi:hypothetical protein
MTGPDAPGRAAARIDVGDLVAALRAEVLRRRRAAGAVTPAGPARARLDWDGPAYLLAEAGRHARVGSSLPEMTRFRGLRRPFARFAARCVLALSRFLTAAQRQFNLRVLDAVRQLGDRAQELERSQNDTVRWLEAALAERDARLERLGAELAELRAGLRPEEGRVRKAS